MTHEVVFDSKAYPKGELVTLAAGYASLNKIEFKNENIIVYIEAKTGEIDFCDAESNKLLSAKIDTPESGDNKFSEVNLCVDGEQIKLGFPEYSYEDNYPNCDGEHDRWTKSISGYTYLCYNYINNCII